MAGSAVTFQGVAISKTHLRLLGIRESNPDLKLFYTLHYDVYYVFPVIMSCTQDMSYIREVNAGGWDNSKIKF